MTPVPPQVLLFLTESGWPIELVLPLTIDAMNETVVLSHFVEVPEIHVEKGYIYPIANQPGSEEEKLGLINQRAQAADKASKFSRMIRVVLPGMEP